MDHLTSVSSQDPSSVPLERGAGAPPTPEAAPWRELQRGIESVRAMLHVALIAVILLSGSATVVLSQQVRHVRREMAALRLGVAEYERLGKPRLESFLLKLRDFALAHPDFAPIFAKYVPATNAPASSPTSARPPALPGGLPDR